MDDINLFKRDQLRMLDMLLRSFKHQVAEKGVDPTSPPPIWVYGRDIKRSWAELLISEPEAMSMISDVLSALRNQFQEINVTKWYDPTHSYQANEPYYEVDLSYDFDKEGYERIVSEINGYKSEHQAKEASGLPQNSKVIFEYQSKEAPELPQNNKVVFRQPFKPGGRGWLQIPGCKDMPISKLRAAIVDFLISAKGRPKTYDDMPIEEWEVWHKANISTTTIAKSILAINRRVNKHAKVEAIDVQNTSDGGYKTPNKFCWVLWKVE